MQLSAGQPFDPKAAVLYGQFVQAAYSMYVAAPNNLTPPTSVDFPAGYDLVAWVQMQDFIVGSTGPTFYGFIAQSTADRNRFVLAIRGTSNGVEWWDDVNAAVRIPFRVPGCGTVGAGFARIYDTLEVVDTGPASAAIVTQSLRFIGGFSQQVANLVARHAQATGFAASAAIEVAGHSLGAALATLYTLENAHTSKILNPALCTFASPAVGDSTFATAFNGLGLTSWRVVNAPDLVPKLPPDLLGFTHVDSLQQYSSTGNVTPSHLCWHSLATYLSLIDPTLQPDSFCRLPISIRDVQLAAASRPTAASTLSYPRPNTRRLRIFSFDPALAARYDLAGMSGITIEIPWEDLKQGPVSEYIEVVDVDPCSGAAYAPVDLNDPALLATDGLQPSESNPQFHQQMCYAVARKTIEHFERALGRKALWSSHSYQTAASEDAENYVPRLRIYPHALRQQNAYYSPQKKALLFGYFPSHAKDGRNTPGTTVFTCLSHDIIAHETTHALLDGVHPRFSEPVNEDVLAFHEAFADIVALFQHFSYPGVLRDQIARTRGDLARESVLGQLAQQFALASGRGDALRSYLGKEENGVWTPLKPNPALLDVTSEPHDRGAILVAAVFGAFSKVYKARTRDLFRIATEGTGVLREGDIHPDLVNRLAEEAQQCADRALQMCIRAIDYCPPVGITFGAYLRAIATADHDINPIDRENWRLAFIESFREWGISPRGTRSMAEDSLLWPTEEEIVDERAKAAKGDVTAARQRSRKAMTKIFQEFAPSTTDPSYQRKAARIASTPNKLTPAGLQMPRFDIWVDADKQAATFHGWLLDEDWRWMTDALGLIIEIGNLPKTISPHPKDLNQADIEIHSVRTAMKRGSLGWPEPHMVVVVTQWRAGFFDRAKQKAKDQEAGAWTDPERDFKYRSGCTLLIDPEGMQIRRVIRTPGTIDNDDELDRMRRYLLEGLTPPNAFAPIAERFASTAEPFALLHSHAGD